MYHRDIKPENIMMQENGHICLVDFGLCERQPSGLISGPSGTRMYMAPELYDYDIDANGYHLYKPCSGKTTEIFSIGKVLTDMYHWAEVRYSILV